MIYKLGIGGLRKLGCVERNYAKAPVAQIRGGFINWEWGVCESWDVWREIMRRRRLRK